MPSLLLMQVKWEKETSFGQGRKRLVLFHCYTNYNHFSCIEFVVKIGISVLSPFDLKLLASMMMFKGEAEHTYIYQSCGLKIG